MARKVNLSATITRNYGAVVASFGASMEFEVDANNTAGQSYYKLVTLIHHQFDEFEANQLKNEPRTEPAMSSGNAGTREWFTALQLVKDVKKGQEQFFILTAENAYAKHGVPCYPEFLKQYKLVEAMNGRNILEFVAGTMVLVDKSTKYTKAVEMKAIEGI